MAKEKITSWEKDMPSQNQVQKTNLSALVRKKIRNNRTYVGKISNIANGNISVHVEDTTILAMKEDHPNVPISLPLQISQKNCTIPTQKLPKDSFVIIQYSETAWNITEVVSQERYEEKNNNLWMEQFLEDSFPYKNSISLANASKKLSGYLQIQLPTDLFGMPGKMEGGHIKISKKILHWCSETVDNKDNFDLLIRKGIPQIQNSSQLSFYFALLFVPNNKEHTSDASQTDHLQMISLNEEEYNSLYSLWIDLVANPPHKNSEMSNHISTLQITEIPNVYRNRIHDLQAIFPPNISEESSKNLRKKQHHNLSDALILEESSSYFEFPTNIKHLIEGLRLPLPTLPVSEGIATIIAWTQSDMESLKNRATDFLLMSLAEGKNIHKNDEIQHLWNLWHETTDPIERICLLVKEGEETCAIQSLVGTTVPRAKLSKKITAHLLQNMQIRLQHHVFQTQTEIHPNLSDIIQKFHDLGIYASANWIERWFLCFISAYHLQTPIILSGPRVLAELICKATHLIFQNVSYASIQLPRRRGHLWGKNDKEHDVFELSPLSVGIRNIHKMNLQYTQDTNHKGTLFPPAILFADDISRHLKEDSLYTSLEMAYSSKGVSLYKEEYNAQWLQEYQMLSSKDGKNSVSNERYKALHRLFDRDFLGGHPQQSGWKLYCPSNLVFVACLEDQDSTQRPEIVQHSFTMTLPDIDIMDAQKLIQKYQLQQLQGHTKSLHIPLSSISTENSFAKLTGIRTHLTRLMTHVQACDITLSPQLIQQITMFCCVAHGWKIFDEQEIFGHIMLSIILPRIYTSGQKLETILETITREFSCSPAVQKRLTELQNIAVQMSKNKVHGAMRWLT